MKEPLFLCFQAAKAANIFSANNSKAGGISMILVKPYYLSLPRCCCRFREKDGGGGALKSL
jgi:hypothetical protein